MTRPRVALLVTTIALALTGCTVSTTSPPAGSPGPVVSSSDPGSGTWGLATGGVTAQPVGVALVAFDDCAALRDHYVAGAMDLVGPWGLGHMGVGGMAFATEAAGESALNDSGDSSAVSAGARSGGEDFSGTNVQEVGVDEPDIVKTDGSIIVTATERGLRVVDVATAEVVGRLSLPGREEDLWNVELLLDGEDLLVLSTANDWPSRVDGDVLLPAFAPTRTTVTRVDLADPTDPTVIGSVRMEGAYRSARMIDGTVRLVLVSDPLGLRFTHPSDGGLTAEQRALEENRRLLDESDLDDWIPHLQVLDADGRPTGEVQRLLDCGDIARPAAFSGLSTVSVLTLAMDDVSLQPTSAAGLVAAGDTVYASTDRLVVATSPWGQWIQPFLDRLGPIDDDVATDLHSFDISDPAATTYVASGSVEGTLIGQFALSEVDGILRVATTTRPDWWGEQGQEASSSSLVVLQEEGRQLVERGRVDGLGVTERIYAVRYLGPELAAIVTFRETDPLYLVDTSDPAAPVVTGELKIPGFSSYLHPVGDSTLLGVGQDADDRGRTRGLQVSLFDIADLAAPERVDQVAFGQGYSPVEYDHRAFLHWVPTGQVVIPVEFWEPERGEPGALCEGSNDDCVAGEPFLGAVVLEVDATTVVEQGRVSLQGEGGRAWWGQVNRSLVIGDHLWTLAEGRIARFGLAGLDDRTIVSLR